MNFLFTTPSLEDIVRLLRAWRFWMLGAVLGALIGAGLYFIAPPPFRAKATVNVDFNLEEAWPQDTDRQQFYYLEREVRKMEEIAWSDAVLAKLSDYHISTEKLRGRVLHLSQPAEAGWSFYADSYDQQLAKNLASRWADAFVEKVQLEIYAGSINEFIKLEVTQSADLPTERSIPLSGYLLAGSSGFLVLAVFIILFIKPKNK